MKHVLVLLMMGFMVTIIGCGSSPRVNPLQSVVFVSYAGNPIQLEKAIGLVESIRDLAGKYKDAPIWIYCLPETIRQNTELTQKFGPLDVEVIPVEIPPEAEWYILSGMVFSAAAAEAKAQDVAEIVVFMGSDTSILQQPDEFILATTKNLGYRPVMHKNISPLMSEPLDKYWDRAYAIMNVDSSTLFPMVTPADGDTIRPYFNAGCVAARPERELFKLWAETYLSLCSDSIIKEECTINELKRVFTFQVALSGTILKNLEQNEMVPLSDKYNYPIFFKEMFGAKRDFHDINGIVTIRHEFFFQNPLEGWDKTLAGPPEIIQWLKEHYIK